MAGNLSYLKLKKLFFYDDNSDQKNERKDTGKDLALPLEKLNLGPKKKLLVLNLGGLLVHRVHRRDRFNVQSYKPDIVCGNFSVFKRPFCDQFMKFCLERFEVGLWSSAMQRDIDAVLDNIMVGLRRKLLFVWGQDQCIESQKNHKPIFLKQLKKIWENKYNLSLRGGRFSESNTLMIDDKPHVALLNPPNTAIFPRAYKVTDGRDTVLGPNGEMQEFLEEVADADDVPTYVKEHPFGQPAITTSHPYWVYYVKIIREASGSNYSDYDSDDYDFDSDFYDFRSNPKATRLFM